MTNQVKEHQSSIMNLRHKQKQQQLILSAILLILIGIITSCQTKSTFPYHIQKNQVATSAMVVSAHPLASQIGKDILQQGGNAVDAAIATHFALAVVYPRAGNLGGGGFMIYSGVEGDYSLDFREQAPAAASEEMYLDSNGNVISRLSIDGELAAGVPGSVEGMWQSYQKLSALEDWSSLLQPAIDLCSGFPITKQEAKMLNRYSIQFDTLNKGRTPLQKEQAWQEGDILKQNDLAKTLTLIQEQGSKGFYFGETADKVVNAMIKSNGIITKQDLEEYKAIWRTPMYTNYRNHELVTMGPPSSGGIALAQLLESVERYDLASFGPLSTETIHLMTESERWVYADRATHLGDPDYHQVPSAELLDSAYISRRMKNVSLDAANISDSLSAGTFMESDQTTHYCVIDKDGNAVSTTTTLNGSYGSKVMVPEAGFLLNNEMDDFASKPGVPNMYGLLGSDANKIEPGKRMLSSMTPTIVKKNGIPYMIVGTPGGSTIITSVFQTIVNVVDFQMDAEEAVATPRFHHQWKPDCIQYEAKLPAIADTTALKALGHQITKRSSIGRVELILIQGDSIYGAADSRGDDSVSGY